MVSDRIKNKEDKASLSFLNFFQAILLFKLLNCPKSWYKHRKKRKIQKHKKNELFSIYIPNFLPFHLGE